MNPEGARVTLSINHIVRCVVHFYAVLTVELLMDLGSVRNAYSWAAF